MTLKWGVIGAGLISERNTIPAILKTKDNELVAVMDVNADRAKQIADKFSAAKFYTSEEELLKNKNVEAVYIATPAHLHAKQVIMAAEYGKHILCEKPMALSIEECETMIAACDQNKVELAMGFMMRFHPHHLKAKELIDSGAIGDIVKVKAQWNFWYPPTDGLWRHNSSLSGGGCLMDVGVHCADLLMFFAGKVKEISALTGNVIFKYPVEDISSLLLRFESGAHGIIENSFAIDAPNSPNGVEIYGTKGVITTRKSISCFVGGTMTTYINGQEENYPVSEFDTYQKEIENFANCIKNKSNILPEGEDGLNALKVVLNAYESAKSKKTLSINL